ncbi:RagB/SusD family nutrient uptake outer membrane protein [Polaribacter batillariae]|uniref:RagB/SusD family nutrient uptake outer membrane protein n=1 Tax=Polaribacter batillariae TaxID=2808900 RepID=A0ABX7SUC9_9FLAO|nr:RagB/SusD family nutrient uptake outer membrane protein [Polaribacter batillariae]QTD36960.1 RagB/SusD family nutrient uptake outer membrane protein [Polaribacter batillariae]
MVLALGCSEDILRNDGVTGDSQPTEFITSAQLTDGTLTNPEIPAAFVTGIYSQMITVGSGGSTSQTDFGQKGMDIMTDMLSGDMALTRSSFRWYNSIANFQTSLDFTFGRNRIAWRYYYRIIRSANNVITNLGGNDSTPTDNDSKYSMGQAKTLRAYAYFYLTQLYQKEYVASEMILPLYLEVSSTNLPKSSAEDVYNQMEKDLRDAISLLNGFSRSAKNVVNQDIAKAFLAYVLGAKGGNDQEVARLTQEVINSGNYQILPENELVSTASGVNGFNDANSNSWMWGIDIVPGNSLGLVSWWGQVDAWSFSYGWAGDYKAMDLDLYNKIPANDVRKGQFFDDASSGRFLQPLFKFRAQGSTTAFGSAPRPITSDYVYMRIEEMYLLNAEANARAGNDIAARRSLRALMEKRVPDVSYIDGLSGQALVDEAYLQTRIELWGEGKSFLALKRNKATSVRSTNHIFEAGTSTPYNDEKMQFEIPQDEIQNNPFIGDQNQ